MQGAAVASCAYELHTFWGCIWNPQEIDGGTSKKGKQKERHTMHHDEIANWPFNWGVLLFWIWTPPKWLWLTLGRLKVEKRSL